MKNEQSRSSITNKNQITKKQCTKYIQPFGGNVFARANDGSCVEKLCSDNWNQTHGFEVIAPTQISNPGLVCTFLNSIWEIVRGDHYSFILVTSEV